MNILHFNVGRRLAVNPRNRHTLSAVAPHRASRPNAVERVPHAVDPSSHKPLRAHWSANPSTGALECIWSIEMPARQPLRTPATASLQARRMHRPGSQASVRPPSSACLG